VLLALCLCAGVAAADEQLGEVVVTAPRVAPEAAGDPTAFATVIDTAAAPTTVETLADALSDAVGVQVRRFGGLGDFSTVSIRGFSAGQVQIYLDGVPLSRADNEVVNLSDLPLDAVDHIEVYRGATPLAFAQSAPGGVVNVVTRQPGSEPLDAASASYGSFTTRKVDVARAATAGAWDYLAFAHYLGSAGNFEFLNDQGTTANTADDVVERRHNNAFDQASLTARVGWHPAPPLALALTTDTFFKDQGVPGAGSIQTRETSLRRIRQLAHLDAKLAPQAELPLDADVSAYVLYDRQALSDPLGEVSLVPTENDQHTTAEGVQAVVRGDLGRWMVPGLLLAGSHERFAESDALRAAPFPARTRLRATVAAEDEILPLGDRVSILPGLRWEIFRDDFPGDPTVPQTLRAAGVHVRDFLSPRLGLRAEVVRGLTLLGNIGRAAREPNLDELFGNRGVVIGNPALRPEVALNRDAGFRLALPAVGTTLADAGLEYAYFDDTITDLIALVQNSQTIVHPENVSSARIRGHEVSLRGRLWSRLGVVANYTHQDARDTGNDGYRGNQLPGRPADEAYAQLDLAWSPAHPLPLGAAAAHLWPGRLFYEADVIANDFLNRANTRQVASRVLHGVGLEVTPPFLPRLRITGEVRNAGDDHTADVFGFPLPGRSFFVTVSYGFGRSNGG